MEEYHKIPIEKICYLAGLLDGEGCIRIGKTNSQNNKHKYDYKGYIQIGMTDNKVLQWVKENFGGNFYWARNKTTKSKVSYNWIMNPIAGAALLKKLAPYLIVKREQAIAFIRFVDKTMHGKPGVKGLSLDNVLLREQCYQNLKLLNKRGI